MSDTLALMVRWDRQGLPEIMVVSDDAPITDVAHALALAQVTLARQMDGALAQALSERARLEALLEGGGPSADEPSPEELPDPA